jgi:hypothetical protein
MLLDFESIERRNGGLLRFCRGGKDRAEDLLQKLRERKASHNRKLGNAIEVRGCILVSNTPFARTLFSWDIALSLNGMSHSLQFLQI